MKNQWSQFPFVLRRKILLTFLAGVASIAVSLVIFTVAADRILLVLGGFIFAASLVLGISLWNTAARGRYEVVEGICAGVSTPISGFYADDAEPVYGVVVDRPVISSSMDHFFFPPFMPPRRHT